MFPHRDEYNFAMSPPRSGRVSVYFVGPREIELRVSDPPALAPGMVRVRSRCSAISAGTELLVYRRATPSGMAVDSSLPALAGKFGDAIQYGYALVGVVDELGAGVDPSWKGRRVFAFNPHESEFCCAPDSLLPVPDELTDEAATLLANAETAVSLVHDGAPLLGERIAVFGHGIVGLLTTRLLRRTGPRQLLAIDPEPRRRAAASRWADDACSPAQLAERDDAHDLDLVFELSGKPEALAQAVARVGYDGRVIVGSWYGDRSCELELGGRFHRSHARIQASQVSHIPPALRGRWTKARRLELAWDTLRGLELDAIVTHRVAIEDAASAYELLDQRPGEALQVLLRY